MPRSTFQKAGVSCLTALLVALLAGCAGRTPAGAGAVAAVPSSCALPRASQPASLNNEPVSDPVAVFDTAWSTIRRTHWDTTYNGVDWVAVRAELRPRAAAARNTGELRAILTDMLGRLKQSHFSIIPREVSDAAPGAGTGGNRDLTGVTGVTLRYIDNALTVTHVDRGSPAEHAGIRTGYVLSAVEGCPLAPRLARIPRSLGEQRVKFTAFRIGRQALDGPVGDTVRATFIDGNGAARDVAMIRVQDAGTLVKFGNLPPQMAHLEWERRVVNGRTIGVIRWNVWMTALAPLFDAAIDSLRGSDAIVLDIRGNPGGVGGMSMGFAGHFVDTITPIGVMKQRGTGDMRFVAFPRIANRGGQRVQPFDGPVAVIVDEGSASTSEIFADGMQSIGRAHVFGSRTTGQALPSVAVRLPNGDILYHAIANFLSVKGHAIEGNGVTPDTPAEPSRPALLDGKDPALDAAVAWASSRPRRAM